MTDMTAAFSREAAPAEPRGAKSRGKRWSGSHRPGLWLAITRNPSYNELLSGQHNEFRFQNQSSKLQPWRYL